MSALMSYAQSYQNFSKQTQVKFGSAEYLSASGSTKVKNNRLITDLGRKIISKFEIPGNEFKVVLRPNGVYEDTSCCRRQIKLHSVQGSLTYGEKSVEVEEFDYLLLRIGKEHFRRFKGDIDTYTQSLKITYILLGN